MTNTLTTQKDLDLLDEVLDKGGKDADPDPAKDASAEKESAKGDGLFDGLDDDDGKADDKVKGKDAAESEGDKGKSDEAADDKGKSDDKPEDKAADEAWRDRVADKILGPLKDKLSAKKFEQRRESLMGQLKRLKTPEDAAASWVMLNEKVRSGEHRKLADEATPEEAAAWRKENNIPEAPEKYDIPAIPGHTWKEADNPTLDAFKKVAHAQNVPQSTVNEFVKWHVEQQQQSEAEYDAKLKQLDREDKEACHDALRAEFGISEFKPSMTVMKRLLEDDDLFGEDGAAKFISSRYFDENLNMWRRTTSDPVIARGLIALALERYGEGAMVSGDGRPSVSANRLDEIDKIMKVDFDRYIREGLADEALAIRQKQEERENKRSSRR